jgi:hypothetical protein
MRTAKLAPAKATSAATQRALPMKAIFSMMAIVSVLRVGACLRRFDSLTLHDANQLVKHYLAELHKKLTRKIAIAARAKIG